MSSTARLLTLTVERGPQIKPKSHFLLASITKPAWSWRPSEPLSLGYLFDFDLKLWQEQGNTWFAPSTWKCNAATRKPEEEGRRGGHVHLCSFHQHVGIDLCSAKRCRRVCGEEWVAGTGTKDDDPALLKVSNSLPADIRFRNLLRPPCLESVAARNNRLTWGGKRAREL